MSQERSRERTESVGDEPSDGGPAVETTQTTSKYKVLGQIQASDGTGVLGQNDATNGTPVGVWGVVPNADGYGLATPDDVKVGGRIDTDETDYVVETGTTDTGDARNVVQGHASNSVGSDFDGATIAGGGLDDGTNTSPNEVEGNYGTVSGGYNNTVSATVGTVGGGSGNTASGLHATISGGDNGTASRSRATVGGGVQNTASGFATTVAGGDSNTASSDSATVSGGTGNSASGARSAVGGGNGNTADGRNATIGGGIRNTTRASWATVGGGYENTASGEDATVGGGSGNTASGSDATVPGGGDNVADGNYSFAAGREAKARASGAFVWGDSSETVVESTTTDEFAVQAGGGAAIYSSNDLSTGVTLPSGSGSWSSVSTRTAKTDVRPVDPTAVLDRVTELTVSEWEYDSDEDATHMGPMAEEFHDAFGLGADEERIANVDADGVALAAIQGLAARLEATREKLAEREERIDDLEAAREDLEEKNESLRSRLAAVESHLGLDARGGPRPADD